MVGVYSKHSRIEHKHSEKPPVHLQVGAQGQLVGIAVAFAVNCQEEFLSSHVKGTLPARSSATWARGYDHSSPSSFEMLPRHAHLMSCRKIQC